jgi:hypothetical protein
MQPLLWTGTNNHSLLDEIFAACVDDSATDIQWDRRITPKANIEG